MQLLPQVGRLGLGYSNELCYLLCIFPGGGSYSLSVTHARLPSHQCT